MTGFMRFWRLKAALKWQHTYNKASSLHIIAVQAAFILSPL
jgi:hypothetical protein